MESTKANQEFMLVFTLALVSAVASNTHFTAAQNLAMNKVFVLDILVSVTPKRVLESLTAILVLAHPGFTSEHRTCFYFSLVF